MSKSTISTFQLFEMFPNQESARLYLEGRLWPSGPICTECGSGDRITTRTGGYYHCNACKWDFTVRTGTIFGRSKIPLHKWVYAMYLLVTARKGISSMQLAKEIGVTQKSAWFMLQRLREACSSPDSIDKLRGIVEIADHLQGVDGMIGNGISRVALRSSRKRYFARPKYNSSARVAWDLLSASGPPLKDLKLLDGLWMCEREDGMIDCIEATYALHLLRHPDTLRATLHLGRISSLGMPT